MASFKYRRTIFPGLMRPEITPGLPLPPAALGYEEDVAQSRVARSAIPRSRIPVQVGVNIKKPWAEYVRIMKKNQAGPAIMAHPRNKPQKVVAIKEVKGCARDCLRYLRTTTHEHIVTLYTAYFDDGSAFLVYDSMSVPLNDILATPRGPLEIAEVATVCLGVTNGLHHIHEDLKIAHGDLSGETILLSRAGQIKIANVGESMLKSPPCRDFQYDLKCLARLLRKMLEPESEFADPQALELLRPQKGDLSVADFLKRAQSEPAIVLLQHNFLKKARGHQHLTPYLEVAEALRGPEVEVFPLIRA